ncbi:CML14 [Symbiodinium natans]|uniref:CML14 protein n=1 Tax=Symbiodinium natans TaxID=878477 RepID=A0A812LLJ9_9DINO|nr:CML14 [Symbiodinium natans]
MNLEEVSFDGIACTPGAVDAEGPEVAKIKDIFRRYDLNRDGSISRMELSKVLRALCNSISEDEVSSLFVKMDTNKDQRIQIEEFVDFIFSFADMSDRAEMSMREKNEELLEGKPDPNADRYKPAPDPGGLDLSECEFDLKGEEPDLPAVVRSLQLLNAQALREIFQKADMNKRGFLRLADIRRILFPDSAETLDNGLAVVKVFAQMDKNSDGKIHCGEFVSYIMSTKRRLSVTASSADKRQIAAAFSAADADANGSISMEEFEHLFGANTASDQQMLQSAFDAVDKNKDGTVSMVELAKVYGKELVQEAKGLDVSGSMDAGDDESEEDA